MPTAASASRISPPAARDGDAEAPPQVHTRRGVRSLEFQPGMVQSAMRVADPDRLLLSYSRAMMCFVLFQPRPRHIVMVGLGGGSLAKFCYRNLPDSRITVLELRADVIALRDEFAIPRDDGRFQVIQADAAEYMARLRGSVDVLLVDGFDEHGLPPALGSARFYADCRRALRPDGVLVANIFSYDPHYGAMLRRLRQRFGGHLCRFAGIAGNNRIIFAVHDGSGAGNHGAGRPSAALRIQQRVARHHGWLPGAGLLRGVANRLLARWIVFRLWRAG